MVRKHDIIPEQIQEIRDLYSTGKYSQRELGEKFSIPNEYISCYVNGFNSKYEQKKQRLAKKGMNGYEYEKQRLAKKGMSRHEYQKQWLAKKGITLGEYRKQRLAKKGTTPSEKMKQWLTEKGMSRHEYQKQRLAKKGMNGYEYEKQRLAKKGMNGYEYEKQWLAKKGMQSYEYRKQLAENNGKLNDYLLLIRLRGLLRKALKDYTEKGKIMSSSKYGINYGKIIAHLNPQLVEKGITPNNIKNYHIDHIIPVSLYKLPEEIEKAFNPLNLRMFEGPENLKKGARITKESLEFILNMPEECILILRNFRIV